MSNTAQQSDESTPTLRRPGPKLNSRGLTLLFGAVLLCPLALITLLFFILPAAHDRPLQVEVNLIGEPGKPEMVRIKNTGDATLQSLRVELNGAFAYFPQAPLTPEQQVDLSLDWFMKKTGQHLDPAQTDIRTVHVSARLPGNQRAVMTGNL